jgi:hypothetical protein
MTRKYDNEPTTVVTGTSRRGFPVAVSGETNWQWVVAYDAGDVLVRHNLRHESQARALASMITARENRELYDYWLTGNYPVNSPRPAKPDTVAISACHASHVRCECWRRGQCSDSRTDWR